VRHIVGQNPQKRCPDQTHRGKFALLIFWARCCLMCGRYGESKLLEQVKGRVPFFRAESALKARYYIAPNQMAPVIVNQGEVVECHGRRNGRTPAASRPDLRTDVSHGDWWEWRGEVGMGSSQCWRRAESPGPCVYTQGGGGEVTKSRTDLFTKVHCFQLILIAVIAGCEYVIFI